MSDWPDIPEIKPITQQVRRMEMSANNHYEVGDKVWYASHEYHEETVPCPICFGKLRCLLTLGDGSEVSVECDYCGKGYHGPIGHVKRSRWEAKAELVTITSVRVESNYKGTSYEYISHNMCLYTDRIFDNEADAVAKSRELAEQFEEEQLKREKNRSRYSYKDFTWQAGYHLSKAARAEKDVEYHKAKAHYHKTHAKPKQRILKNAEGG